MSVRRLASPNVQPKEFAFTAENLAWAKRQIAKFPESSLFELSIEASGCTHYQAMDFLCRGHALADVSAVLSSLDMVRGEVDR